MRLLFLPRLDFVVAIPNFLIGWWSYCVDGSLFDYRYINLFFHNCGNDLVLIVVVYILFVYHCWAFVYFIWWAKTKRHLCLHVRRCVWSGWESHRIGTNSWGWISGEKNPRFLAETRNYLRKNSSPHQRTLMSIFMRKSMMNKPSYGGSYVKKIKR